MSRLIDQGPYREAADMPEVKIKKEWYCWLDDTGTEMLTLSPALLGGFFWCLGLLQLRKQEGPQEELRG